MSYIAITFKAYGIVAIQAVAKLATEQNRKGAQWDYILYEKP